MLSIVTNIRAWSSRRRGPTLSRGRPVGGPPRPAVSVPPAGRAHSDQLLDSIAPDSKTEDHTTQMSNTAHRRIDEIEGIRGLALILVVLFHLFGRGRVSGGVDVFLFVSGFLLTLAMLRSHVSGRPQNLRRRYERMVMRLTPPALLVLTATVVMTLAVLPASTWTQTGHEIVASALYYENWELISSQLAYGAAGPSTSPVQHFWSLSVQGQFFLVWPLLLALVLRVGGRRSWTTHLVAGIVLLMTVASFIYAWSLNASEPAVAYFDSFTRFWELGAGALLAIAFSHVNRFSTAWRVALGWTGAALIIASGFVLDGAQQFPGPAALIPVAGAALIIVCSGSPTRLGVDRALATPPVRWLARISYPLYLWHWPILIAYLAVRGYDGVGILGGAFVLAAAILLAWLTQRFVSEPVLEVANRRPRKRYPILALGAAATLTLIVTTGAAAVQQSQSETLTAVSETGSDYPGALVLTDGASTPEKVDPAPDASIAFDDLPEVYQEKCIQNYRDTAEFAIVKTCAPRGDADSPLEIVMAGGSHTQQWADAMTTLAERHHWRLTIIDKDGCRLSLDEKNPNASCVAWNKAAIDEIIRLQPDAVFTVSTKTYLDQAELVIAGQVEAWKALDHAGIRVVGVRDTPRFPWRIPECLEQHAAAPAECGLERSRVYAAESPSRSMPDLPESFVEVDVADGFCSSRCEPIVGNVTAYRDDDHMTASYSTTLVPLLERELEKSADFLFG
ncbi:acyltransferase family protein [Agromyces sp. H3Y2-19a]|uniref:acyltransferase family protein n=1 Tax=Agromyces chromiiresistens TaxID=3030835 RepID=UPI0023B894B4|nr:acyltransferase family protein [Agromyces chromiiresistens]MDF0514659.1 acyltransferase family protein [Agromyces chromiiresistens]